MYVNLEVYGGGAPTQRHLTAEPGFQREGPRLARPARKAEQVSATTSRAGATSR